MVLGEVADLQVAVGVSEAFLGFDGGHQQLQQSGLAGTVLSNLKVRMDEVINDRYHLKKRKKKEESTILYILTLFLCFIA